MLNSADADLHSSHVSFVAEGLRTAERALSTVQNPERLFSVCLHGNLLASCAHFSQLVALTCLNLSANQITTVKDLGVLQQLVNLNLSSNRLVSLDGFPTLPKLDRLNVAHNRLTCLTGLCSLDGGCLSTADIRSNRLSELRSLAVFASMPSLRVLSLSGGVSSNPIAGIPGLQAAVAAALPQVSTLHILWAINRAENEVVQQYLSQWMQVTKLDGHIRKAQPGMPQDKHFAALQLAAFQTLPSVRHNAPTEVHHQHSALPASMPRGSQRPLASSDGENDQAAANMHNPCSGKTSHLRQSISEPQEPPVPEHKPGCYGQTKDDWHAHERRLAALEASLLSGASLASKALSNAPVSITKVCLFSARMPLPPTHQITLSRSMPVLCPQGMRSGY
jgi:hypothetical protein